MAEAASGTTGQHKAGLMAEALARFMVSVFKKLKTNQCLTPESNRKTTMGSAGTVDRHNACPAFLGDGASPSSLARQKHAVEVIARFHTDLPPPAS